MANLLIRKSASENISIPLTTEKPIARSLAIFKDGQIHYAPLVVSGEYLDSGVKVRIGRIDYALATQIYDPTVYDSTGDEWIAEGNLLIPSRGTILFPGNSYLTSKKTYHLASTSYVHFYARITPYAEAIGNNTYWVTWYNASNITKTRVTLVVNQSGQNLQCWIQTSSATPTKKFSFTVATNTKYELDFTYDNGTWAVRINDNSLGTFTKNLSENDYTFRLGNIYDARDYSFNGEMSNISLTINGTDHFFRAGDHYYKEALP